MVVRHKVAARKGLWASGFETAGFGAPTVRLVLLAAAVECDGVEGLR